MHFTRCVRKIVRRFPSNSFVRKFYNNRKVSSYANRFFTPEQIREAELDRFKKSQLLSAYAARYPKEYDSFLSSIDLRLMSSTAIAKRQHDQTLKDELLFCRLAYGFSFNEFFCFELEEKTADQRKQYISEREHMEYVFRMNDRIDISLFNDKSETYHRFRKYYDRDAVVVATQDDYRIFMEFVEKHSVFVKKKVNESMGRTVELIDLNQEGRDADSFFKDLLLSGKHLIEERIIQDPEMAVFNESSVNTVRCITFMTPKEVLIPYCFIKCGRRGSFVDNGGAGGILAGIDQNTGMLNTDGFDELHTRYFSHPDSKALFKGYKLPSFNELLELCRELSAQCLSVRYIGWDLAYSNGKWVVVEGNGMSQFVGPQLVYERGIKQEVIGIMKGMDLIVK